MLKKISIAVIIVSFLIFGIFFCRHDNNEYIVKEVVSPVELVFNTGERFTLKGVETFDAAFSERNKNLAVKFGISENEAFVMGNLAKYWAENLLKGRDVKLLDNDLVYYKFGYYDRFINSPFCIKDGILTNRYAFDKLLASVKRAKYGIVVNDVYYPVSKENAADGFILMRKSHYNKIFPEKKEDKKHYYNTSCIVLGDIKLLAADFTTKLKPDRNCSSDICKEILFNINNSKSSIDIAIYGYSSTPAIENAIKKAMQRGVKIRLVYDVDSKNQNIYPDTFKFVSIIPDNMSDKCSKDASLTMHNKFYIFDEKTVITGSANLSHTDMSGFNSNNIIVINSPEIAKIYKTEFEQMYSGKFHSEKAINQNKVFGNISIYFSPQDKPITNGVLPVIQNAKKYIYIPVFFITERRVVDELIRAKNRGVDVRIILDALSASNKYSKHRELRLAGVSVKTENYAGKMHSKTMIIDDNYIIIGSMNFSYSGENKNDENMIILKNQQAAVFLRDFFLYQWNKIPDKWLKYSARAESLDSIGSCYDGIDNDYDGLVDSQDEGCKSK